MRLVILLGTALVLSACGAQQGLKPQKGESLPMAPYGAKEKPTAEQLLKPSNQTRPARSDELLRSSDERRSDDFDLPPPN
jgi:hypothetical protein